MAESNVKTSYYILLATFNTYMFSTLAFFWYNRKLELLQKRQPLIIAIHAITAICIGNDYVNLKPYNQIHWMYLSSGDIGFYLTNYFCAPLWLLFVFLRCCTVVSQYYSNIVYVTREMKMVRQLNQEE
ncbi:hypothetical protein BKA69DRAFT_1053025 [Paraphysoderma sedebokerense]|nr:hypothetical protein BKA69DRAFT_1053025 [Paraphysoderma sedebokerense]